FISLSFYSYLAICFFFLHDTSPTEIYTLSLHDALPICEEASDGTFISGVYGSSFLVDQRYGNTAAHHAGQGRGSEASGVDWCDGIDAATSGLGDMGTKGQPARPAAATSRYVTWTDSDRRQSSGTSGAEIIERGIVAGECLSGRLLRSRSSACCRYDPHAKVDSLRCATGWSSHKSVVCFARDGRICLPDGDFSGELAGMGTIEAEFYLGARGGTRAPWRFAITMVCVA